MESRRSQTSLSHLTLAPLTSRLPIDDDPDYDTEIPTPWEHRTSYIAGKSAPTTPRILSRSPSQTRLGRVSSSKLASSKSYTQLAYIDPSDPLYKSRSTTLLVPSQFKNTKQNPIFRYKTSKKDLPSTRSPTTANDDGEWLFRTGTAISLEGRESKGQSWLVNRESSTSLVAQNDHDGQALDTSDLSIHESSFPHSRHGSRLHSRVPSTRTSRRGSRVGSKVDLTYIATPKDIRTPAGAEATTDYFQTVQNSSASPGPDFVDEEKEDEEDVDEEGRRQEAEVAKLANNQGYGVGSMVDRLLRWTLFDVNEDDPAPEEDDIAVEQTSTQSQPITPSHEPPPADSTVTVNTPGALDPRSRNVEAEGGWKDAAWLLSVASKVIL